MVLPASRTTACLRFNRKITSNVSGVCRRIEQRQKCGVAMSADVIVWTVDARLDGKRQESNTGCAAGYLQPKCPPCALHRGIAGGIRVERQDRVAVGPRHKTEIRKRSPLVDSSPFRIGRLPDHAGQPKHPLVPIAIHPRPHRLATQATAIPDFAASTSTTGTVTSCRSAASPGCEVQMRPIAIGEEVLCSSVVRSRCRGGPCGVDASRDVTAQG